MVICEAEHVSIQPEIRTCDASSFISTSKSGIASRQYPAHACLREPNVIGPAHTWSQPIRHVVVHGTPGSFFLAFDSLHVVHQYSREKDERGTV